MSWREDEYMDARNEAREEEDYDRLDQVGVTCECGERYDPEYHRATRTEPAYAGRDTCPKCGSDVTTDDNED